MKEKQWERYFMNKRQHRIDWWTMTKRNDERKCGKRGRRDDEREIK